MSQDHGITPFVLSVNEFCDFTRIKRSRFFRMQQEGTGPRTFKVGRQRLISRASAEEWIALQEQRSNVA